MRINSVRLVNFRQHANTFIEFDSGLTGIIGANGTGKTTILEAIAWALYGTAAARGNRDSIRSIRAAPRAMPRVELEFDLGGHHFRVIRGLTSAELFLDRAAAPIANTVTGVTEVLRRRLGMSLQEFFNTYFTGQKELAVMATMKPTERAQFLSRLLGYERLRVAQELARERRRAIVAEATGMKSGMPDPDVVQRTAEESASQVTIARERAAAADQAIASASAAVAALAPQWTGIQEERDRAQRIDVEIRVAEGDESARQRELVRLDHELIELASAGSEVAKIRLQIEPLLPARAELEIMNGLASEEGRRQTLIGRQRELTGELGRLNERLLQIESAPRLAQEVQTELSRARESCNRLEQEHHSAHMEWVKDRQEADTKIEQLKASLAEFRKQREILVNEGEDGTCPICSRPLGDHYRSVLEMIDDQIQSTAENGRYFRARVEQLATVPADVADREKKKREAADALAKLERKSARIQLAVQELEMLKATIAERDSSLATAAAELAKVPGGYSRERHDLLRAQNDELQTLESRAARLAGALERESQLRAERDRVAVALEMVRRRLGELRADRATISEVDERFEKLAAKYEAASTRLRACEVELATAQARLASTIDAADKAARALADLQRAIARLDELVIERRLHEELDRSYTDLRTDLNLQLRPEISERASELLAELTDGRYAVLELDENYEIIVLEDERPKSVISGGEEDLANLVLRLAISQMIAERAGQPLSLLILDEVFGSLDESRRHNVVDLLRRLHDRFEQVIVITHIESVREGLDRVVTVSYDEESGSSRVYQEAQSITNEPMELEMGAAD
jgi:exonuclease SbcC